MERDLESHARTLDLPYCFTDGAHRLSDAWVSACAELGHDVEVGVYFSNSHAIHAEWHRDENHNFTFQLVGQKDWYHLEGDTTHGARPDGSRGMFDAPRNRAEHAARAPPAGLAGCPCVSMAPGSVLYLPPGHWHRVVPVEGPCVSVNLRIGQLLRARWLCEALFAALAAAPRDGPDAQLRALGLAAMQPLGGCDFGGGGDPSLSVSTLPAFGSRPPAAMDEVVDGVRGTLQRLLSTCPLPRALPCERALSNGLERAASLAFLARRGCLAPAAELTQTARLRPSALVAITLKARGAGELLVHLTGASSLTGIEFLRFAVHCSARLAPALALLLAQRAAVGGGMPPTVAELRAACPPPEARGTAGGRRGHGGGGGVGGAAMAAEQELGELLRALLYMRALVLDETETVTDFGADTGGPSAPGRGKGGARAAVTEGSGLAPRRPGVGAQRTSPQSPAGAERVGSRRRGAQGARSGAEVRGVEAAGAPAPKRRR